MTTASSFYNLTDTIVYDYLTRHCDPSLAEKFKDDRGVRVRAKDELFYVTRGLTLEKAVFSYFKANPPPHTLRSLEPFSSSGRVRRAAQQLPVLVIQHILKYVPTESLFLTRGVNRHWNALSSESLRNRYRVPIRLQSGAQICKLAKTFANLPNDTWLNPFVTYHFFPEQAGTVPLLKVIGLDVKIGIFEYVTQAPVATEAVTRLLQLTPDIEQLCFYGNCHMTHVQGGPGLRHLRTLGLSRGPSPPKVKKRFESFRFSFDRLYFISSSVLQNWRHLAPCLEELRCNYQIRVASIRRLRQYVQLCSTLRLVVINSIVCPRDANVSAAAIPSSPDLNLALLRLRDKREADTSNLISALGESLTRLTLTLEDGSVPAGQELLLRHLTYMKVSVPAYLTPAQFAASSFQRLSAVTLKLTCDDDLTYFERAEHPFEKDVFPTVSTLRLIFVDETEHEVAYNWAKSFPRVTSLGIASALYPSLLRDLDKDGFLDHVTHLHLCQTERRCDTESGLFDGGLAQVVSSYSSHQCYISDYESLEHLELECLVDFPLLVLEVMTFSVDKQMQPLQQLTIHHSSADIEKEAELFYSLRDLNRHKNLKLVHQPKPSYKSW